MRPAWLVLAAPLAVSCGSADEPTPTPPSGVGTLEVIVTAAGPDRDIQYVAEVDAGEPTSSGKFVVAGQPVAWTLPAGSHTLSLTDVAPNCTADGATTRSVTITSDAVTTLAVAVTCTPFAFVRAQVTVSGIDLTAGDPRVGPFSLNCADLVVGACGQITGESQQFVFGTGEGPRELRLGIPTPSAVPTGTIWCKVNGDPATTVAVTAVAGDTVDVPVAVDCLPLEGTLAVTITVSGTNIAQGVRVAWGYAGCDTTYDCEGVADLGGGSGGYTVGLNASVYPGPTTVLLAGLEQNCRVTGDASRQVNVPFAGTVNVPFEVACE